MPVVTITHQIGSYSSEIAQMLAQKLHYEFINQQLLLEKFISADLDSYEVKMLQESPKFYLTTYKNDKSYIEYLKHKLKSFSQKEPLVFFGTGANFFFDHEIDILHVKIIANLEDRILRTMQQEHCSKNAALVLVQQNDRKVHRFAQICFQKDSDATNHYHLILNSSKISTIGITEIIATALNDLITSAQLQKSIHDDSLEVYQPSDIPQFKNQSEIDFSKLLDMYHIRWRYEPKHFPVEWNEDGQITLAFSPDFYLPHFDLYLELTTMNQKYVTQKNKKAKKAHELYGVNVRIVYKRDFESLLERFESEK